MMTTPESTSAEAFNQYLPGRLIAASNGWKNLLVRIYSEPRFEESVIYPAVAEPRIVRILSGAAVVEERELGGPWLKTRVEAGDFFLTASQSPYEVRWRAIGPEPYETMHLYLGARSKGQVIYRLDSKRAYIFFICLVIFIRLMRQARIKGQGTSYYHCVSRVVERRFLFRTTSPGSEEAEYFVRLMRRLERAYEVRVLTYALMSNHFHILCKVPARRELSDQELLTCIEAASGPARRKQVTEQLAAATREGSSPDAARQLRERYASRLFDVSIFIKELKGRFAQWYNRRHRRYGVFWAERFKSVLIEPGHALNAVAAYIDLNPLRAGLCEDPKDYRYSGYAEAVAKNSTRAQRALGEALGFDPDRSWREVSREYRKLLFQTGTSASKASATIDLELTQRVVQQQGEIPLPQLLRCRVRYFTDGGILGSRAFVQDQFRRFKQLVNPPRSNRAHRLPGVAEQPIWVLRDLRLRPIG